MRANVDPMSNPWPVAFPLIKLSLTRHGPCNEWFADRGKMHNIDDAWRSDDERFDVSKIVGGQFNCRCSDVLLQAMEFRGARYWNNPWLLCEQPRECNLSRCRLLPFCDLAKQINQNLIGFASLRRKAREGVAQVGA